MLFLDIINFHLGGSAAFGVIGSQTSGFFKRAVRQFSVRGFYDHMGACHFFCVEPPVISGCLLKGQLIVLEVVFSYKDIKAVTGNIVEGL